MKSIKKEESEAKLKETKEKVKDVKKEKEVKETVKKDSTTRDNKINKEVDRKKEDIKKTPKEADSKKDNKSRDVKDAKKDQKATKTRLKTKDEPEDSGRTGLSLLSRDNCNKINISGPPMKKERKDSESSRESMKSRESLRGATKRSTRQSIDSSSRASSSPVDIVPYKRRRL